MMPVLSRLKISVVVSILAVFAAGVLSAAAQRPDDTFVIDELLVKLKPSDKKRPVNDRLARLGLKRLESLGDLGWLRVRIPGGDDPRSAAAALLKNEEIEAVQPNYYYHLEATPNDPRWNDSGLYGLRIISAPQAWDLSTGSSSVVVANIDTGMRYTHEDLAGNMWSNPGEIAGNGIDDDGNGFADDVYGYDFFYNDPDPLDEHGHGTHTGGTIGAAGNNLLGVVGVNWSVKIMAIKIYNNTGFGTTSAMLINAYNYIRTMKNRGINIRVTNNSYSGCDEACGYDQATKDALDAMGGAGILNVFAAGNNSQNNDTAAAPNYPASYTSPSVMAVASSTSTDVRSSFSAYGPASVDLAAPGSLVLSTTNGSNSSYGVASGTSMAAPHVTGAAALLSAYDPSLSAASLKATLMNTVDLFANLGTTVSGNWSLTPVKAAGRLNISNALQNRTFCSFGLSSTDIRPRTKGGFYTVTISAGPNCDYAIKSSVRWIKFEGPDTRSGSGQIVFRIGVNPTITRTGTISVAGQIITVTQSRS